MEPWIVIFIKMERFVFMCVCLWYFVFIGFCRDDAMLFETWLRYFQQKNYFQKQENSRVESGRISFSQ